MIKDVINNPKTLLKGDRIRAGPARSRRASRIAEILETVVAGRVREIALARGRTYRFHSFRGEEAVRTEMLTRKSFSYGRCRSAHLRRYSLGATPISRLNTRLNELSDPYPMADATSEKDILFERIIAPALYIRQRVR